MNHVNPEIPANKSKQPKTIVSEGLLARVRSGREQGARTGAHDEPGCTQQDRGGTAGPLG